MSGLQPRGHRASAFVLTALVLTATAVSGRQSTQTAAAGDAPRGAAIVTGKGGCLACHRILDQGSRVGPDLTDIGAMRSAEQLRTALVEPNAEILPENRFYRLVTRDGEAVTGRLLNLDTYQVLVIDPKERLRSFYRAGLREHGFIKESSMPSYRQKLTVQELADVVAYLGSLKGVAPQ